MQIYGRAGRNGTLAHAHLLYTSRQIKKIIDPSLNQFCGDACKENSRRQQLLVSLGSKESIQGNAACCDVCTGSKLSSARLDVLVPLSLKPYTVSVDVVGHRFCVTIASAFVSNHCRFSSWTMGVSRDLSFNCVQIAARRWLLKACSMNSSQTLNTFPVLSTGKTIHVI